MSNPENTEYYRFRDYLVSRAARSIARTLGVKTVMHPLWNRWRASLLGEENLARFMSRIDSIATWPQSALRIIDEEEQTYHSKELALTLSEKISELRKLSFVCHLAQWGCLSLCEEKRTCYVRSRDYYIRAEELAQGNRYHRVEFVWKGNTYWGNLHLPAGPPPHPLIIIFHGMDDSKEEHLMTEIAFQDRGFAVFGFDGPGQAESLYLNSLTWTSDFNECGSAAITTLVEKYSCAAERVGVAGISWGGMWAIKAAAADPRIKGVYDLGGPIDASRFEKLPYFLKSKFVEVLTVTGEDQVEEAKRIFTIKHGGVLEKVTCPIRIVHGGKDPIVPVSDKEWLRDQFKSLHPQQSVDLIVHSTGDHCCTPQALEVRKDAGEFFSRCLNGAVPLSREI